MSYLYKELEKYAGSDYYPFHMPGHKRHMEGFGDPYQIDITEIEGFDNLHHAEGILKKSQECAAKMYHSEHTHFLVNGSTGGILSAVSACTSIGGTILMARNCHKAVYHSVLIRELKAVYMFPQKEGDYGLNCGLNPKVAEEMLITHPDIQAVIITSPTYDGIVSDVEGIAQVAHRYGKPLIVDEAHGAHFGFHPYFPQSAVQMGADIVIHSLHKTLPAFTQTGLIHVNGFLVDDSSVEKYLGIYQSSSPSYLLMAGIERCICLLEDKGEELFESFAGSLQEIRKRFEEFKYLSVAGLELKGTYDIFDFDCSKIVISAKMGNGKPGGWNGNEIYHRLREEFHLQLEMAAGGYALALTSIMDDSEGFERLYRALKIMDDEIGAVGMSCDAVANKVYKGGRNEAVMKISEADCGEKCVVLLENSEGRIAGEFVYLYPPGIPLIVPGERIGGEVLREILGNRDSGFALEGMRDFGGSVLEVLREGAGERFHNG